jgi:hypothetical protein
MNAQVIPTYVHAMGDYLTSTTAPYAARRLDVTPATRRIVDGMAAMAGMQSLMTDYEGGAMPVMPMRAHLAADMAMGVGLLGTAAMMRNVPRRDRQLLAGLGAFSLVYALLTQPERSRAREFGDVLDDGRFTEHSPAHAGFAD